MKVINWNYPESLNSLFKEIHIHSLNNGFFDQNNPKWISSVTKDLGDDQQIYKNLLRLFREEVTALRCYHATRLFFPKKIYREGLKKLSLNTVYKICKQAGYSPFLKDKEIIRMNYKEYTSKISDGRRSHIYAQLDLYNDMLTQENNIQERCSFFQGGEVLGNTLPSPLYHHVLQTLKSRGMPTIIHIDLPITEKYLDEDAQIKIANRFFCLWFNCEKLKLEPFANSYGLNIKESISGAHIKKVILYPTQF